MNGALIDNESLRRRRGQTDFSYKFQRLRERIRQAVASGDLNGKLPGERELARRFQVNAKTLSKALTDLAAEGLLSRSIGRGTFVKGAETETTTQGKWLLVCDAAVNPPVASQGTDAEDPLVAAIMRQNPQAEVVRDVTSLRPSFLNHFSAVVDLGRQTPQQFVRDLLVRNMPVVLVGREPETYSTNAVLLDVAYLASRLGRELMMSGHRRLAAVGETTGSTTDQSKPGVVTRALRAIACRYAPDATVVSCSPQEVVHFVESGVTALVCDGAASARLTRSLLSAAGICVPNVVSVAAIGSADADYPCSGFYIASDQEAESVVHLLQNTRGGGTTLWLTGKYVELGTTGAAPASAGSTPPVLTLTA